MPFCLYDFCRHQYSGIAPGDMYAIRDILIKHMFQYSVNQNKKKELNNRIGIFYIHTPNLISEVFLISGMIIYKTPYKFHQERKIYVSMQKSDTVNMISILPFYRNLSLKAVSMEAILKQIRTKFLTNKDLENLELPNNLLEDMKRRGLQIFRHLG
ncbi:uncharacterized protein LOC116846328 [Odontomachus brunneus]|uniref:uncharacterized protein LOC116846328 n=1 Tax=Odontomachus brunneus TaxID=486640 RepID=UPI0013F1F4E5|nr:uncharacterized protein LOC116846328 [Odontomachus brunneus]